MKRLFIALLLTLLAYLCQTCVVPYLKVYGVVPNLIMVNIAVLTVSYGKKFAFSAGALSGILIEAMNASVQTINVVFYPVAALVCAQIFADMNERKREWRRMRQKRYQDLPYAVRIPAGAAVQAALLEMVMLFFLYLNGVTPTVHFLFRSLIAILYTALAAAVLMFPQRWIFGMYRRHRRGNVLYNAGDEQTQYYSRTTPRRFGGEKQEETTEDAASDTAREEQRTTRDDEAIPPDDKPDAAAPDADNPKREETE